MIRNSIAAVIGIIAAGLVVAMVESAGHIVFPLPLDVDLSEPGQLSTVMDRLPWGALVYVVAAWFAGSFSGGYLATLIARRESIVPAMMVAAVMLLGTLYSLMTIPHPLWMAVAGIAFPLPAAWLGAIVAGLKR